MRHPSTGPPSRPQAFRRAPSLRAPIRPSQLDFCFACPTRSADSSAPAPVPGPGRDRHADGGVWPILGLLLLVTLGALYLFWAKLAATWPFDL